MTEPDYHWAHDDVTLGGDAPDPEVPVPEPPPRTTADIIGLSEGHRSYLNTAFPGYSEEVFAYYCCTHFTAMPEDKVAGYPVHIPGMNMGTNTVGWERGAPIVYVAPAATDDAITNQRPLSDPLGLWLRNEILNVGIPANAVWVTHALRFALSEGMKTYRESHKKSNAALLRADVYHMRPKLVIASGVDALHAFFGKSAKIENYQGQFKTWEGIPVLTIPSHNGFAYSHASLAVFRTYLERARDVITGAQTTREGVDRSRHRRCLTAEAIVTTAEEIIASADSGIADLLVFDTEFGNDVAREEFTYVRSIQVCWGPGVVAYFGLVGPEGAAIHSGPELIAIKEALKRLFEHPKLRLGGHHLRVDIQRLYELGIDVDEKLGTGLDTMLLHHLLYGDDDQGLEVLIRKFCPEFGNYWEPLSNWLDANRRTYQLRYGYRNIPDDILIPYSLDDAHATWVVLMKLLALFKKPENAKLFQIYEGLTAPTSLHIMDMERQGILVDDKRRMEIREIYTPVYEALLKKLRDLLNWEAFNPGSKDQVLMLLFSDRVYKDKKPKVVPEGARVLTGLMPEYNTDKYPKQWDEIAKEGKEDKHTPSTDSDALDLMMLKHPCDEIKLLREVSILGKFLRDYLYPIENNEHGVPCDGKGIHNNIWADGRIRTHLWQTSETHRYRSSKPNLQTSPKRQESEAFAVFVDYHFGIDMKEYKRRTDDKNPPADGSLIPKENRLKIPSYKSCMVASEGHILVEADFKTAELAILAFASGDPVLTAIIDQGRDLHSEMACKSFKLPLREEMDAAIQKIEVSGGVDVGAYETWVKKLKSGYDALRGSSKTINFGERLLLPKTTRYS